MAKRYTQGRFFDFDEFVPRSSTRVSRKKHYKRRTSPLPAVNPVTSETYQTYRYKSAREIQALYDHLRAVQLEHPKRRASFFALLGRAYQEKQVAWAEELEASNVGVATYGTDEVNGGRTVEAWRTYPEYAELDDLVYRKQLKHIRLDPNFPQVHNDPKALKLFMDLVQVVLDSYHAPDFDRIAQELYTPFCAWFLADGEPATIIAAIGQMYNWHPETDRDAFDALAGVFGAARIQWAELPDMGSQGTRLLRDDKAIRDFGLLVSQNPELDPADLWEEFVEYGAGDSDFDPTGFDDDDDDLDDEDVPY